MTKTENAKHIAAFTFVVARYSPAFAHGVIKNKIATSKERRETKRYDKKIAKMQENIGEYKPATIPVQVWA